MIFLYDNKYVAEAHAFLGGVLATWPTQPASAKARLHSANMRTVAKRKICNWYTCNRRTAICDEGNGRCTAGQSG